MTIFPILRPLKISALPKYFFYLVVIKGISVNKERLKNDFFSFIAALNTGDPPSDTKPALHNVDWSAIVPAIEKAGMAGYISSLLARTGKEAEAPADVFENLRKKARRIAARNVFYETECAKILKGLSAAGLDAILLKGFSYMHDIYGDTSTRAMSDIDLLIRPAGRMTG